MCYNNFILIGDENKMPQNEAQTKTIKEIFPDYQTKSNISMAKVKGLNLRKKSNVLELSLNADEYIEIKELWYFEKYLRERFNFENVEIRNNICRKCKSKKRRRRMGKYSLLYDAQISTCKTNVIIKKQD